MKSLATSLLLIIAAGLAFYAQTDGFTVLTTESARRASIAQQALDLPEVVLTTASGQQISFTDDLATDGRTAIINFMFTRCVSVCIEMGLEFQQLQETIKQRKLNDQVRLISISFDPRDTPKWLDSYQKRMHLDPEIWQAVSISKPDELKTLLRAFGIIVVPAPLGQFEHNTAYHVVSPDALLNRIVDINETDYALYYAQTQAKQRRQSDAN